MPSILIVDRDQGLIQFLTRLLVKQGHEVVATSDPAAALDRLAAQSFELLVVDHHPPQLDGLELLAEIKRSSLKTPLILTASGGNETAIEAMQRGAYDFLLKPFDTEQFKAVVADAIQVGRRVQEVVSLPDTIQKISPPARGVVRLVGTHRRIQEVFKSIGQVADKDVTVLITGESGTGKELVARAIHHYSRRRDKPLVAMNCAAIPDQLFESELFGYERGAFTGADRTYLGRFERCHEGTLFLDEIGDMSLGTQAKVLRVLQEGEIERLGGGQPVRVDVRLLAATNKNLEQEVAAGRFREDLFYRLKIISIALPPLRARLDDLPALVDYFAGRFAEEYRAPVRYLAEATLRKLRSYHWPGNVRELENCLRRAVLLCQGDVLLPEHVRFETEQEAIAVPAPHDEPDLPLRERANRLAAELLSAGHRAHANMVEIVEEALIRQALQRCAGNQVHASRLLGISRNTLRHRMEKYRLEGGKGKAGHAEG